MPGDSGVLWIAAVAPEGRSVMAGLGLNPDDLVDQPWNPTAVPGGVVVLSGVGKANAAGLTAQMLGTLNFRCVVSAGVAGALRPSLPIGQVVLGRSSVYGDEGVESPDGLLPIQEIGFPPGPGDRWSYTPPSDVLDRWLLTGGTAGEILTVSAGAGTEALRSSRAELGCCEAMEGAAVFQTGVRLGVPGIELRSISNTTGNRSAQQWDLHAGLTGLAEGVSELVRVLRACGLCE